MSNNQLDWDLIQNNIGTYINTTLKDEMLTEATRIGKEYIQEYKPYVNKWVDLYKNNQLSFKSLKTLMVQGTKSFTKKYVSTLPLKSLARQMIRNAIYYALKLILQEIEDLVKDSIGN